MRPPVLHLRPHAALSLLGAAVFASGVLVPCAAWWDTGHMLTAAVARERLDPSVSHLADQLLGILRSEYPGASTFVGSAHWADDIKSEHGTYAFRSWHFIDYPYPVPPLKACSRNTVEPKNIVWALERERETLRRTNATVWDKAFALRFTIHLMGDVHQPLHCASRCTVSKPRGDGGGNGFALNDTHFTNLHKFWDAMGGQYADDIASLCPFGDHAICLSTEPERERRCVTTAAQLVASHPTSSFAEYDPAEALQADCFTRWARESFSYVQSGDVYGGIQEGGSPSSAYTQRTQEITRKRVVIGGYRLADYLNANLRAPETMVSDGSSNAGLIAWGVVMTVLSVLLGVAVLVLLYARRRHAAGAEDSRLDYWSL